MTLRQYLTLMSLGTALCWLIWFFIVWRTDPFMADAAVFLIFYASLFLALLGTFSVLGFIVRGLILQNDDLVFRHVKRTFRQSVIVSGILVFALFLWQKHLLTWWNALLLLVFFGILEGIIFTNRKYSGNDYVQTDNEQI